MFIINLRFILSVSVALETKAICIIQIAGEFSVLLLLFG